MLEILAEFVCNSDMGVLAPMEQDVLRAHVADAACALVAGACSPEGIQLRALLRPGCAREEIGGIAAAIIRSTEVDDIHIEFLRHAHFRGDACRAACAELGLCRGC